MDNDFKKLVLEKKANQEKANQEQEQKERDKEREKQKEKQKEKTREINSHVIKKEEIKNNGNSNR